MVASMSAEVVPQSMSVADGHIAANMSRRWAIDFEATASMPPASGFG
jgi:hypothetical protein